MDTGAYMANQMDDLITASQMQYDDFCEKLEKDISEYIKNCEYTFDSKHIFNEYITKYTKGYYVSYKVKKVIKEFEDKLKKIYYLC